MANTIGSIQRSTAQNKIDVKEKREKEIDAKDLPKGQAQKQDSVVLGTAAEQPVTYAKPGNRLGADELRAIHGQEQKNLNSLRNLVRELILKQNVNYKETEGTDDLSALLLPADGAEGAEAAAETAPLSGLDDYYSVEAVSDRIVNFAISISGGDKSKLDALIAAIDKGFSQAREAFGRELPDICSQTHTAIMEKLDAWASEA